MSSWLLDSSPGAFQICLRKFIFCLSFELYHITPSLSRLNIESSTVFVEIFTIFDILSNSFTVIVVHKVLCLKLQTLRLYCLDILPEYPPLYQIQILKRLSSIAIIYIERSCANHILRILMDRIIDIFEKRKDLESFM